MSRITKNNTQSVSLQVFAHKGFILAEATNMESCYNSMFDIYLFDALIVRQFPSIKDRREFKCELELIQEDHSILEEQRQSTIANIGILLLLIRL